MPSVASMERTEYHELLTKLSQLESELEIAKATNQKLQKQNSPSPTRPSVDVKHLSFAIKELADQLESVDFADTADQVSRNISEMSTDIKNRATERRRSSLLVPPAGKKSLFAERSTKRGSSGNSFPNRSPMYDEDFASSNRSGLDLSNMAAADSPSGNFLGS